MQNNSAGFFRWSFGSVLAFVYSKEFKQRISPNFI